MRHCEYLIFGQGLAGSILAWELIAAGKNVLIVDDGHLSSSSKVAAGMINPLAGKRLALYPETNDFLDCARGTYARLKKALGQTFFHEMPILRLFQNELEVSRYADRRQDEAFDSYLGDDWEPGSAPYPLGDGLGGFITQRSGWVDVPGLISGLRKYFSDTGILISTAFSHDEISITENRATWRNEVASDHIVFCEGWRVRKNPWFDWLPWDPVKGEILSIKLKGIPDDRIVNSGKWLIPGPSGDFRVGSTYSRGVLDLSPTEEGLNEIHLGLSRILPGCSYEILSHRAGIRPRTRTQHPFLGRHPEFPQLGVFNGFGSKGALLIPHCARQLIAHYDADSALRPQTDIRKRWKR